MALQTALASAEGELEDADLDVGDLPAPAVPAAAAGDVDKSKKKRKAKSDEDNGASASKDAPASPQVCLLLNQTVPLRTEQLSFCDISSAFVAARLQVWLLMIVARASA